MTTNPLTLCGWAVIDCHCCHGHLDISTSRHLVSTRHLDNTRQQSTAHSTAMTARISVLSFAELFVMLVHSPAWRASDLTWCVNREAFPGLPTGRCVPPTVGLAAAIKRHPDRRCNCSSAPMQCWRFIPNAECALLHGARAYPAALAPGHISACIPVSAVPRGRAIVTTRPCRLAGACRSASAYIAACAWLYKRPPAAHAINSGICELRC